MHVHFLRCKMRHVCARADTPYLQFSPSSRAFSNTAPGKQSSVQLQAIWEVCSEGLQLVQPYLVLQIFVPQGHQFSFELRSLDAIVLGPVCKLRKIFTSRKCPAQSVLEAKEIEECLPAEHAFLAGVDAPVQVIDTPKIQKLLGITSDFGGTNLSGASLRVAERKRCTMDGHMDVAFGSTVRTNHTTNCRGVEPRTESYPAKVIERQAIAKNMKASRDKIYSSQKKVAASDIEGQSSFKVLNQKALSYPGICHSGGTPIFSVQDEFIANNFVAPEENSVDVCLNLTSKHGRKMKRLNMIKELEISKGFRVMRSSQRERGNSRDSREPEVELQQQASPSKLCNSSNRDDTLDHDQVSQNSAERGCIANGGFNLFSTGKDVLPLLETGSTLFSRDV
ncbi:hypothetical protein KP509_20G089200 [Ceratopteris richardii]|uniref:Uncharacterized protein n=1 Tax=Ceratopteris richardii TaxID=49495 RepID=A0A8T2SH94_CERRI|nr:hypothetical protein KP509_20G089200 [Ceratopteris richardii]